LFSIGQISILPFWRLIVNINAFLLLLDMLTYTHRYHFNNQCTLPIHVRLQADSSTTYCLVDPNDSIPLPSPHSAQLRLSIGFDTVRGVEDVKMRRTHVAWTNDTSVYANVGHSRLMTAPGAWHPNPAPAAMQIHRMFANLSTMYLFVYHVFMHAYLSVMDM